MPVTVDKVPWDEGGEEPRPWAGACEPCSVRNSVPMKWRVIVLPVISRDGARGGDAETEL